MGTAASRKAAPARAMPSVTGSSTAAMLAVMVPTMTVPAAAAGAAAPRLRSWLPIAGSEVDPPSP